MPGRTAASCAVRAGSPARAGAAGRVRRRRPQRSTMRPSRTRQILIPGRVTVRPDGSTPKISPCCVPLAVKCSTTRSSSPTRMSISLCQSGKAARNMAPAARMPSRSAVTPIGGSWLTNSPARYSSTAPRSPLLNRASMNEVTVFLFCSIASMTAVCGVRRAGSTPATWGLSAVPGGRMRGPAWFKAGIAAGGVLNPHRHRTYPAWSSEPAATLTASKYASDQGIRHAGPPPSSSPIPAGAAAVYRGDFAIAVIQAGSCARRRRRGHVLRPP